MPEVERPSEPPPRDPVLRPYALALRVVAAHFALFTLARLALYLLHHGDFASLSAGTVALAFLRGLLFDASIIFTIILAPVALLLVPLRWAQSRWWRGIAGWACYATILFFLFLLAADIVYFGYVHRHVGPEVQLLEESLRQVAASGVKDYLPGLLGFLAAGAGLFWLWRRLLRVPPAASGRLVERTIVLAVATTLMGFATQGAFTGKRLKIINAFVGMPPAGAHLALNGPFSMLHSWDSDFRSVKVDYLPWDEAVRTTREDVFAAGESGNDADYPLLRSRAARPGPKPNVVVVMLESWDAHYLDCIRREHGLAPLGVSPGFDEAARGGVLFPRFYAAGQRSMEGMSALLCSYPTLPTFPFLGKGLEQSALSFLGRLARREGYRTLFLQTEERDSFRADAIADMAGFDVFLGAEDIPLSDPGRGRALVGGAAWDHEMYREAIRRFASTPEPFLGYLYTGSTHPPFQCPDARWEKWPRDTRDNAYRNGLHYADGAFGEFMEAARKAPWFERTVFLVASDHIAGGGGADPADPPSMHHIPGLVIAPGLSPGVDRRIGSQLDVLPTIMELAGWSAAYAGLGRSLLDPRPDRAAVCVQGSLVLRVEEGGWVLHDFHRRVDGRGSGLDAIERRLLSFLQVSVTLLRRNRLCRPE
ncbi:MAG: sulfatase-like hydrolase/transferase [Planctomycetes bacterium]|nr:sulfatase-like hydrolase/transferase [Planctomycetota bacterium]